MECDSLAAVTLFIALVLAPFIILTLCFAIEVLAGLRPFCSLQSPQTEMMQAVIVVPAHDEELGLRESLARLREAAEGLARILVVADNCTDRTATIAREARVEVIERNEPEHRGKGYALDFAKRLLAADPPELVVVLDADCGLDRKSLQGLLGACASGARPCQAIYLQEPNPDASPTLQLSTFAFFVKNVIRQRGLQRLTGRVHLQGTGMAFPWSVFARAELASGNIVEDLEMGLELAAAGHPAELVEAATVWTAAASVRSTIEQRRRWEGGYLQSAAKSAPGLLIRSISRGDLRGVWAAFDLFVPPMALLVMLDILALIAASIASWLFCASAWPVAILALALAVAALAILLAWRCGGWRFVSLRALASVPIYLAWKLPLYLGLVRRGAPTEWVRTGRG
jgi:cellulose synthase/poly-beta-1,6-N-acetylglucosamine synthase-like glycosyltransferase